MTLRLFVSLARASFIALICALGSPSWAEPGIAEVQALIRQAQYPVALVKVNEFLARNPKDPQARFAKGVVLTELNRSNEAIAIYLALVKDRPELPEPYNNLAVIYASQKQYDKAKAALEMAIRTHPAYATAHENLGDVYAKLASQAYGKALQLDSSNALAQTKLAQIRDLVGSSAPGKIALVQPKPPVLVAAVPAAKVPPPAPNVTAKPAVPVPSKPVVIAKVEPKPKPEPEKKPEKKPDGKSADKSGESASEAEIRRAVSSWASAWSRKDVRGYLAHYSSEFRTPNAKARKEWEAERESRLTKPGKIHVEVDGLKVKISGDEATVRFRQTYDSANLKSSSGKTLVLKRRNGRWQIQQERIGG